MVHPQLVPRKHGTLSNAPSREPVNTSLTLGTGTIEMAEIIRMIA
jgi:hypothetical protein